MRNDDLSSCGDSGCIEHCPLSCDSLKNKGSFWLFPFSSFLFSPWIHCVDSDSSYELLKPVRTAKWVI